MKNQKQNPTVILTYGAILTAIIFVMQLMGSAIRFGTFSISLVLIPIVLGAALCGKYMGAWLGLVFGVAVLVSGDAAVFYAIHAPGTILTVLLKGTACGFLAGVTYELLAKWNVYAGTFAAALVCPIVNTGVFLLGCRVFFYQTMVEWASADFGGNAVTYIFLGLVGLNFLLEVGVNLVLSPVILRLLRISKTIRGM